MSKFTILRKPKKKPELNIAPLIDMVFLLLIFFMVATTIQKDYGIEISKPEASTVVRLDEKSLVIAISGDGEYVFDKKKVTLDEIRAAFGDDKEKNGKKSVIILADKKAYTKTLIDLLDELRGIGVVNLSIGAKEEQK